MNVTFNEIEIGKFYSRDQLTEIWGYQGRQAISKGVVTPRDTNLIILFITKVKQGFETQYKDSFENGTLEIEGPSDHRPDQRIVGASIAGDEIHLFFRERHHSDFEYCGEVFLFDHKIRIDDPSMFKFTCDDAMETEAITYGFDLERFAPDPEGRKRVSQSISYERSKKNRAEAIRVHGNNCIICGFSFDEFYGAEFAKNYIQVHHTRSITELEGKTLDIKKDLAPVCANCHCMAHRKRGEIIPIEELKAIVIRQKKINGGS